MTHEAAGVLAFFVVTLLSLWVVTSAWSVWDSIKRKEKISRILLSLVPLVGPLMRYLSLREGKAGAKIIDLVKRRWVILALIIIIALSMYVRLADYRWDYLRNIDSYTFYRAMDDIVLNGGVQPQWDDLVMAPHGNPMPPGIQPYVYMGAYSFMLVNLFVNSLTLFEYLVYFPAFLASLAAIPMYFIGKILYDRKAGVIAAFIFTFDINNLARSLGGDPDSDASIFFLSMIAIAAMLFMYKYAVKETTFGKRFFLYAALTGIAVWIWFNSWAGYWYVFWLFTGLVIVRLLFDVVETKSFAKGLRRSKFVLASFAVYMTIAFALSTLVWGNTGIITDALAGPIQFQSIKGEDSQFPNVYVSVAELQQGGGAQDIIARTSILSGAGLLISPFFLFIYTMIYLLYSYYKRREHIDTLLFLIIWFVGPFLATLIAIRFSVLFSAPLAIGSAILLAKIIRVASGEDKGLGE